MLNFSRLAAITGILIVGIAAGCGNPVVESGRDVDVLTVWVDVATANNVQVLLNAFEADHPEYQVTMSRLSPEEVGDLVLHDPSSAAITLVPLEAAAFSVPIAFENMVFITGQPASEDVSISQSLARDVASGRMTQWAAIMDGEADIQLVIYQDQHPIRLSMETWLGSGRSVSSEARTVSTTEEMERILITDPNSVGITLGSAFVSNFSTLQINEISAFVDGIPNSRYPMQAPVLFSSREQPSDDLAVLLEWIQSEQGRKVLVKNLVIP